MPQWRDDYMVAEVHNFCAVDGCDALGWEEMTQEEIEAIADEETTVVID